MHAVAPSTSPRRHTELLISDFSLLSDEPLVLGSSNAVTVSYLHIYLDLTVRPQQACQGWIVFRAVDLGRASLSQNSLS